MNAGPGYISKSATISSSVVLITDIFTAAQLADAASCAITPSGGNLRFLYGTLDPAGDETVSTTHGHIIPDKATTTLLGHEDILGLQFIRDDAADCVTSITLGRQG